MPKLTARNTCMSLVAQVEALLFVAAKPVAPAELAKAIGVTVADLLTAISTLEARYAHEDSGFRIMRHAEKVALVTSEATIETAKKFLRAETNGELTRPALETLTIIAYRGPVTKPEIEQIRGVNCSLILRNLLVRGLVEEGKNEAGELVYEVTHAFLAHLGIAKLTDLPEYDGLRHHPELEKALRELTAPKNTALESQQKKP